MSTQINLPKRIVEAEQHHTGIMVAFMLGPDTAESLALPGGEPEQDLHVTLASLGDSTEFTGDIGVLKETLSQFAAQAMPVQGVTSGLARFTPSDSSDGQSPVIALVNIQGLQEWRRALVSELEDAGFSVANDFDYTPHITLAYVDADAPMPIDTLPEHSLQFDTLCLAFGDDRTDFPLGAVVDASDTKTTEATTVEATYQPKPRIAQLKVKWLSDNAVSRNGRQYPTESVNRLVQSGQIALQSNDIINSYICHGVADEDNPLVVSGKATRIWKEGADAYALFDIPDTTTGRDMVALLQGGYIPPTMSLRATGSEMKVQRGSALPQVVGSGLTLQGIDFTARPGIEDARIQELLLEAAPTEETLIDSFALSDISLITEQEEGYTMATKAKASEPKPEAQAAITEEANQTLKPLTSGDSQSVDGTPGSDYTKKFPKPEVQAPANDFHKQVMEEAQATHDHMAEALGMACSPSKKTVEAGRKFNKVAESHMMATHDAAAKRLGMACEGTYQSSMSPQADDDESSMESVAPPPEPEKEPKKMTEEEAKALLEAQGYAINPPKTETEKLQESFEAKLAVQQAQFEASLAKQREEMTALMSANQPATQRKTLVENTTTEQRPPTNSPRARRTRIQENLLGADWETLADRSAPLPEGVTPDMLLEHFGRLMLIQYQDKWGNQSIRPAHS